MTAHTQEIGMRLTKLEMSRVVVTALFNMDELVRKDHPMVLRKVRSLTSAELAGQHKLALAAIRSKQELEI